MSRGVHSMSIKGAMVYYLGQLGIRVDEHAVTADQNLERHHVHLSAGVLVDVRLRARYSCSAG